MQRLDGVTVFSATDLVGFLACGHLTNLERAAMAGLVQRPMMPDPELDRIAKRGIQHEQRFLAELQQQTLSVVTIDTDGSAGTRYDQLVQAATETLDVLRQGVDVVYQATFFDGQWRGHADFLRKVNTPSTFGPWSYEVWDTKLARHTKGSAILQLCLYTDQLAALQEVPPEHMYVALGGSARTVKRHRFADYAAYYRLTRSEFLRTVDSGDAVYPPTTLPDPVDHCDICRWNLVCRGARRQADDLSLVAGITARQRTTLRERAITTRTALGALPLPLSLDPPLRPSARSSLGRMREQARLQVTGEQEGKVLYELLDPRDGAGAFVDDYGLLMLPEPSPGDLFFDIEGDPFALEDGVDYLFGVLEPAVRDGAGRPAFHRFWSIDDENAVSLEAERAAFEALIDLLMDRLERDQNLHVYHYAPYEPSAVRRLMGRYGTREEEVDRLLRGGVFVDLYRAVHQGIRASVESYSIKSLEPLYGFARKIDLRDASSSIVAFETWLELGDEIEDKAAILARIEAYNRDDSLSAWMLRDWLEERRLELATRMNTPLPRPKQRSGDPDPELAASLAETQAIVDQLVAGVSDNSSERSAEQQAQWLLAQLLNWHRREDKSTWWRYFALRELTDGERIDEPDALGGLTYEGVVGTEKRSRIYRFRFPPQDHKISVGASVRDPNTDTSPGQITAVDDETGTIDLKRGAKAEVPRPTSLVPFEHVSNDVLRASLQRVGEWVANNGIDADGPFRAARQLLIRRTPSFGQADGAPLIRPNEHARDAALRLVHDLDETYLAIQGPPGSGKTTIGAEMIVDLVQRGKRIGVTANSHQVIGNLLRQAVAAAERRGVTLRIGQKPSGSDEPTCAAAQKLDNDSALAALRSHDLDIVGGTAWLWSRQDMIDSVDVLFVDEAGQMSLANAIAVAPAGRNLVLLGDPQQLDQPQKGSHPPGAERSVLGHILAERPTMPEDLGLFLETTWRLHPDICSYTSEIFYEGRLQAEPGRELQRVTGSDPLSGAGLRFIAVEHEGNSSDSGEEASAIARLVTDLLAASSQWTDCEARDRALSLDDVLIVTPYNAQVREIAESLPGGRVGTVDKFQGQESPISVYSMATSSADEAPRGMEFLYNLHRLNVATSRARCLAVVVASPQLLLARCRTPRQMRLSNALARLAELAQV